MTPVSVVPKLTLAKSVVTSLANTLFVRNLAGEHSGLSTAPSKEPQTRTGPLNLSTVNHKKKKVSDMRLTSWTVYIMPSWCNYTKHLIKLEKWSWFLNCKLFFFKCLPSQSGIFIITIYICWFVCLFIFPSRMTYILAMSKI